MDAIGSIALVHHFRHGLRHDQLSDDLEELAHRVVLIGLVIVGCAAVLGGSFRLRANGAGDSSNASVVLAGVSLVALIVLAFRKQQIARRIGSGALLSDGHLSAVGAMLAGVALTGTVLTRSLGWHWADAAATMVVGGVAIWLGGSTWPSEYAQREHPTRERSFATLALA